MKTKKSKKANLENYRTIFLQIGAILTLSAILFAFEWKSEVEIEKLKSANTNWVDITELPPVTRPEQEKIVKPPAPVEHIIIREDDVVIEDDPNFIESDIEWNEAVDITIYEEPDEEVYEEFFSAEFMPRFQGKEAAYFRNYVASKVKFPSDAIDNGITGTVIASFVVDKKGEVTNVSITRGVHSVVDKAVIKAIQDSPIWEPGMNNGKYVNVRFSIAIAFQLQ